MSEGVFPLCAAFFWTPSRPVIAARLLECWNFLAFYVFLALLTPAECWLVLFRLVGLKAPAANVAAFACGLLTIIAIFLGLWWVSSSSSSSSSSSILLDSVSLPLLHALYGACCQALCLVCTIPILAIRVVCAICQLLCAWPMLALCGSFALVARQLLLWRPSRVNC